MSKNRISRYLNKLKPVYLPLLTLAYAVVMTSCNTAEGTGEDIQRGGKPSETQENNEQFRRMVNAPS